MAKRGQSGSGEGSGEQATPRAPKRPPDPEFAAIRRIGRAVESLTDPRQKRRVIKYVLDKLGEDTNGSPE